MAKSQAYILWKTNTKAQSKNKHMVVRNFTTEYTEYNVHLVSLTWHAQPK